MSLNQQDNKLIACSCNNSFVGVWVVDLSKLAPFSRQSGPSLAAGTALDKFVLDHYKSDDIPRSWLCTGHLSASMVFVLTVSRTRTLVCFWEV